MTGIVRAPRPEKNFTEIRNSVARDARLSYRARGVLVRLLSNADGFRMTAEDLAREGREGRTSVLAALRELRGAGYVQVRRGQNAKGQWQTETVVFDAPQKTEVRKPYPGFPNVGRLDPINNAEQNPNRK